MSDSNNLQLSQELKNLLNASSSVKVTKENLWENDLAKREKFAKTFTTMIGNIGADAPAVILLEGEWGSGKTFFLKSFQQHLVNNKYKAIYFDAFAEDFSADPLLAICGQLWMSLSVDGHTDKKILKDMLKDFLIAGMETGLRAINLNKENISTLNAGLLIQYSDFRKKLETLKENLSSIAKKSDNQSNEGDSKKPLVFIIDELDRCRPTFSLELLERVKHLFQVPGIVFVFGANKKSLMASVESEYGNQDPEYLQKFFDFELKLPKVIPSVLAKQYVSNLDYKVLVSDFGDGDFNKLTDSITDNLYYPLMDIMGVTLRQAQRSVQMLLHCLLVSGEGEWFHKVGTVACLTLLKVSHPKLYADIAYKNATCEKVIQDMTPVFKRSTDSAIVALPHGVVEVCHRFFNMSIAHLANGEEKQRIEKLDTSMYNMINELGIENDDLKSVKQRFLDRSEIIAMLENLDCRS